MTIKDIPYIYGLCAQEALSAPIVTTLAPGETKDVDSNTISSFHAVRYHIRISNEAQAVYKYLQLKAVKTDSDDVSDSVDSRLGNNIDVSAQVIRTPTDILLCMVNNEAYSVDVRILKILV